MCAFASSSRRRRRSSGAAWRGGRRSPTWQAVQRRLPWCGRRLGERWGCGISMAVLSADASCTLGHNFESSCKAHNTTMTESFVGVLISKLSVALANEAATYVASQLSKEASQLKGLIGEIRRVKEELESIMAYLHGTEKFKDTNETTGIFIKKIRDLAFRIEDVVDEFTYKLEDDKHLGFVAKTKKRIRHVNIWGRLTLEIRRIYVELEDATKRRDRYAMPELGMYNGNGCCVSSSNPIVCLSREEDLVGIEDNVDKLKQWLMCDLEERKNKITTVWGMGGVGKSTLVDHVYKIVKNDFDAAAWVTVSKSYQVEDLLKKISREFGISVDADNMEIRSIVAAIRNYLEHKTYILVLDDIWEQDLWINIMDIFPSNCISRFILTSRNYEVASLATSNSVIKVEPLGKTHSWKLFCSGAFRNSDDKSCPMELHDLSAKFLRKCEGLPIAIACIGRLLSCKPPTYPAWKKVYEELELQSTKNAIPGVDIILKVSLDDLSYELKNCFLHCALFPEAYEMKRRRLMRHWIAAGFIKVKENKTLEEVAESFLNELVNRSLLQVMHKNEFGRLKCFRMHDVLRHLALGKAEKECFGKVYEGSRTLSVDGTRRLSIQSTKVVPLSQFGDTHLRAIYAFTNYIDIDLLRHILESSNFLSALDLEGTQIKVLPNEVFSLFNLRLLGLRYTGLINLPEAVGRLQNLEVLDVYGTALLSFPKDIAKLKKLRYLYAGSQAKGGTLAPYVGATVPRGIQNLTRLHALQDIKASLETICDVGALTELRTFGVTNVTSDHSINLCSAIMNMSHLVHLDIGAPNENEVLPWEALRLPETLSKLGLLGQLENKQMPQILSSWSHLSNLTRLTLVASKLDEDSFSCLIVLHGLCFLHLIRAYDGKKLYLSALSFPRLRKLRLKGALQLNQVEIAEGALENLAELELSYCPELKRVPDGVRFLRALEELRFVDAADEFVEMLRQEAEANECKEELIKISHIRKVVVESTEKNFWRRIVSRKNFTSHKCEEGNVFTNPKRETPHLHVGPACKRWRMWGHLLKAKTAEFRVRLARGETLSDVQAEAFAVVREAARRTLGMRHFDVQIIGGAVLHDGCIAEMKTGEGKTLVSTLAAYLNALTGEGVHVVTVNDYLAQRDAEWMGRVHRFLGLTVGLIQELGFDYLRDNLSRNKEQLVMRWPRPFHFAIVDEVDSVLIDEGRNPLLISGEDNRDAARYPVAAKVAELLMEGVHYTVELKGNNIDLTEDGVAHAEIILGTDDLWDENDPWARFVMNALKAKVFYRRDVQYIVRDGKAIIINEPRLPISSLQLHALGILCLDNNIILLQLTGRVEPKRRWSDGIHQAVEAKEDLNIQADSVIVAQITYQSLFKLYPKLSGMTGTAKTEEKEFLKMFKMPVIEVPTNLPNIRLDLPIQAFATARGKWQYVRAEVESMFQSGRPVLVGTTSVESSEYLSDLLKARNIPHNVLNARPKMLAKEIVEDNILPFLTHEPPDIDMEGESTSHKVVHSEPFLLPNSAGCFSLMPSILAKYVHKSERNEWSFSKAKSTIAESIEMGQTIGMEKLQERLAEEAEMYPLFDAIGLAYLSVLRDCEIHCSAEGAELRGRAGRQGDPGSTRFMVSLQDEIFQKFNLDTEWAVRLISRITNDEDIAIESNIVVKQLLGLQINAEKYYFGIRKSLVEFDEVLEVQRKHVYNLRQVILSGDSESCSEQIFQYMQAVADEIVLLNIDPQKPPKTWNLAKLLDEFVDLGGKLFSESFKDIQEENLQSALEEMHGSGSVKADSVALPNMPVPPDSFRGIRKKTSSVMRWFAICVDDTSKKGRYTDTVNLLRKYFGDFLIATYLNAVQESRYDDAYISGIEREVLLKTLDALWKDHLVNMNKLSSAVNVRSFGHRNPLEEYKIDGCRFFISMLSATRQLTVESLLHYWSSPMESDEIFNTEDR
ncbi:Protein translocase subunit SECA2, chloroplastic [Dichanthelium oligosanthes]|uniref:chloroplast protein-transporting ATPase n=1 Tax=Dichanthelium oligosanthes TaxID=888268 RepID=A0A1E5VHG8_9POAL|nr:Protein translocase subunit SECA2, chloroplastic [Dichanthelium oligosanthes]